MDFTNLYAKVGRFNGYGHIYVDELWVEPTFRGRGIAKCLMKKADELLTKSNSAGIRLYVNQNNKSAKDLYERCGFSYTCKSLFMEK